MMHPPILMYYIWNTLPCTILKNFHSHDYLKIQNFSYIHIYFLSLKKNPLDQQKTSFIFLKNSNIKTRQELKNPEYRKY